MGVAINEEVHAGHILHEINGAIGGGGIVHAQMTQSDHDVALAFFAGDLDAGLSCVIQLFALQEVNDLHQRGVGFGHSFGSSHAKDGQIEQGVAIIVRNRSSSVGIVDGVALVIHQVDAAHHEFGLAGSHVRLQLGETIVKLVVTQSDNVVAHRIHHFNGGSALAQAHIGRALAEVARVHQDHRGSALGVALISQSGHLGVLVDGAMDIVGVQDNSLAVQGFGESKAGLLLSPRRGHQQGQGHDHGQEQC